MPTAVDMNRMWSFTTLTPYYSETVTYSAQDFKKNADGVSDLFYLQKMYPDEWRNFLERLANGGSSCEAQEDIVAEERENPGCLEMKELRLWASYRGQTLARTVRGMMVNAKALNLLCKFEEKHVADHAEHIVRAKFQFVVSCQVYARMKREKDRSKNDWKAGRAIDELMEMNPDMRVAFIDNPPGSDKHYSCLVKWSASTSKVKECYRVELAGNPVIGEGKPENQNHAIIFTRGESVQTVDMNQDGNFEEGLKMRNLLSEFDQGYMIVGFPEVVFTSSLSSLAMYMAEMERTFVTLIGRTLSNPLSVRMHYGHPDLHDKYFVMAHGGVSKANKGLNLNEDIFSAFNATLRGGKICHRDYVQCGKGRDVGFHQIYLFEAKLAAGAAEQLLSRDMYRLGSRLDWFRLQSFYYGGVGFYVNSALMGWTVFLFVFTQLFNGLAAIENQLYNFSGNCDHTVSGNTCEQLLDKSKLYVGLIQTFPMFILSMLLTLPTFAEIALERGWLRSAVEFCRHIATGSPLFFMFHLLTKLHWFKDVLLYGNPKYQATGRGFVVEHTSLMMLFQQFAESHFYKAADLVVALLLYAQYCEGGYGVNTWSVWLIVLTWLFAPIWFNPHAFDFEKFVDDAKEWRDWLRRENRDPLLSWRQWHLNANKKLQNATPLQKLGASTSTVWHVGLALGAVCNMEYAFGAAAHEESMNFVAFFVPYGVWFAALLLYGWLWQRFNHKTRVWGLLSTGIKLLVLIASLVWWFSAPEKHPVGHRRRSQEVLGNLAKVLIAAVYLTSFAVRNARIWGLRGAFLTEIHRSRDIFIGGLLHAMVGAFAIFPPLAKLQMRVLYNRAFSEGVDFQNILNPKLRKLS